MEYTIIITTIIRSLFPKTKPAGLVYLLVISFLMHELVSKHENSQVIWFWFYNAKNWNTKHFSVSGLKRNPQILFRKWSDFHLFSFHTKSLIIRKQEVRIKCCNIRCANFQNSSIKYRAARKPDKLDSDAHLSVLYLFYTLWWGLMGCDFTRGVF